MTRVAIMGAGSWGTAFGMVATEAGNDVVIWGRDSKVVDSINSDHVNREYLPDLQLPPAVWAVNDPAEAMHDADLVVLAIPSAVVRGELEKWRDSIPADAIVVSLIKGIELDTGKRMSEVINEVGGLPLRRIAVLSGPNLAPEIAAHQPAASVVACSDDDVARMLQERFRTSFFRPYTNSDVIGTELGGAVKNVIALAVGMAAGMGYGDNTKASLITRGLAETVRLGAALGADPLTFVGLAGLGDLVATCASPLSRNRSFGEGLGRGLTVDEVKAATRQTAEGVTTCRSVLGLAKRAGVDVPITEHVVAAVLGEVSPREMVGALMGREAKPERSD